MLLTYLIRFGLMGHIAQFRAPAEQGDDFRRGQVVVIRSNRGMELGEVLTTCDDPGLPDSSGKIPTAERHNSVENGAGGQPNVCRAVGPDDLVRAQRANELRPNRFSTCQRILEENGWPWELLDVEPLLDGETIVLHYLGPHQVDAAILCATFRVACKLNVVLEPVGVDVPLDHSGALDGQHGCGDGCGSSGHGSGGCAGGGCKSSAESSGCASCGISRWIADRRK
jgi:hypothetical protein